MFAYGITHCLFVILLILFIRNICDPKTIMHFIIVNLCFEFVLSAIMFFYTYSAGLKVYCNLGSINIIPGLVTKDIILIYDSTTFFFQSMVIVIVVFFLVFLMQYFEYDYHTKKIIVLSSIFSQLALIFFCTYDLLSIICLWGCISMVSFFLVHYWSKRVNNVKYNIMFFFISLVGDFFFLIALFFILIVFETTNVSVILERSYKTNNVFMYNLDTIYFKLTPILFSISFFLKSYQFIFLNWILYSTENTLSIPEQVYSITQTITFFYIFYRLKDIIIISESVEYFYYFFSFFVIITATFLSFFQDDVKKLLACSAASQLSYSILCISIDLTNESLILLFFFFFNKAFMFFWFGFVKYEDRVVPDMRLRKKIKLSTFEKIGLILYIINLTSYILYIYWQIKVLLINVSIFSHLANILFGLDILKITWLFSSLYLLRLCVLLFSLIYKRKNYIKTLNIKIDLFLKDEVNIEHYAFLFVMFLIFFILFCIINFLIILFI
jgi:NADH:ubiquinone oxidoreductase subunit 5 (subunit L)/multisubunit Na+/H+ antiporter MnhA subunit